MVKYPCKMCKGTGKAEDGTPCTACEGTGEEYVLYQRRELELLERRRAQWSELRKLCRWTKSADQLPEAGVPVRMAILGTKNPEDAVICLGRWNEHGYWIRDNGEIRTKVFAWAPLGLTEELDEILEDVLQSLS